MLLQSSASSSPSTSTPDSSAADSIWVRSRLPPRGQSWHNNVDDRLTRKLMMLRLRRLHPVLAGATHSTNENVMIPSLVQRLEWMLYNAAHSMHEYTHEQSLERRVQALVTQLEPKIITEQRRRGSSKRGRGSKDNNAMINNGLEKKRRCTERMPLDVCQSADKSEFLLGNDINLVGLTLSFLSGRTVLSLRSVNRFMFENAPAMVSTLHLETHSPALRYFSSGALTSLLLSCSKLTSLVVTSNGSDLCVPATKIEQPAKFQRRPSFSRPLHRDGTSKPGFVAELLLHDIARAFDIGACPELQELNLGSPLDYFAESDDVLKCLQALATGRRNLSRTQRGSPVTGLFKQLSLDSTYLGDSRLNRLADVFELASDTKGVNCFASLEVLVLRSNFIGEGGCQALLRMLRCLPSLRVLDLSGNILTDLDAIALAEWIAPSGRGAVCDSSIQSALRRPNYRWESNSSEMTPRVQLRTLLVQDNFISHEGLEALSAALNTHTALS